MSLSASRWQRRPMTLTPLIDIIFLLLLFFMLSSTFTKFAELPLQNARGGGPVERAPLFLQLTPDAVTLNGTPHSLETLPAALAAFAVDAAEAAEATVLITLDGSVSSQRLVDLLGVLRQETWLRVSVLG